MITVNTEGKLLRWYDDVGAMVEQGDAIAEIQTADGNVSVLAPQAGRLTEMLVLAGDDVQAGQIIGMIDTVEMPQSIGTLIDPPAAERKLKPKEQKRKPRPLVSSSTVRWTMFGLMALFGVSGLMVLMFGPVSVVDTRVVTSVPNMPMPTPRFRMRERVLLNAQVGDHFWGEQGVVQNSGFEMGSGTWYDVQFGDEILRLGESQLEDLGSLAPTPTMQFNSAIGNAGYTLTLKEAVADFPAGTRVTIGSAMFNGVEYELNVTTENGVGLTVRESQLEVPPDANPGITPTPVWISYVGENVYALMTNQFVGKIPPNTSVRLTNMWLGPDGDWIYTIAAEGSFEEEQARTHQLSPAP